MAKAVITSYFDDLNSKGGINGRRVEIKFVETGDTPGERRRMLSLIRDEHIFALSSPLIAGAENEMLALAEEQKKLLLVR